MTPTRENKPQTLLMGIRAWELIFERWDPAPVSLTSHIYKISQNLDALSFDARYNARMKKSYIN